MLSCGVLVPQLDGSIKSAQTLFARYDMDLDQRLRQQDYYDLCLELALALPYQEYQRFVEASFAYTGECAEHAEVCWAIMCRVSWGQGPGRVQAAFCAL